MNIQLPNIRLQMRVLEHVDIKQSCGVHKGKHTKKIIQHVRNIVVYSGKRFIHQNQGIYSYVKV